LFSPRVLAALAIPIFLVLAGVAALALRLSEDEAASQSFVDHTYQVIVATQVILTDVQSAEIAERGYRVGGGPAYLTRVRAGLDAAPKDVARFRTLTLDNPDQRARADQLKVLLQDWSVLVIADTKIPLIANVTSADQARIVGARRSLAAMVAKVDEIRAVLNAADDEEHRLLATRTKHTEVLGRSTLTTGLLGALFVVVLLISAVVLLFWSNTRLGQTEAARGRQANMLQATLDSIRKGIVVFEADGRLAAFNPNFFRLSGFPASLAQAGTPLARFRAFEAERAAKLLEPDFVGGNAEETRHLSLGGRSLDVYSAPVPNDGFLVVVEDVTVRVRAEEAARQAQKMEAIGHLTGGVAHDFNNLLQVISANLDLAASDAATNPRLMARLRNAEAAVERGSRLTAQLLAFARRQALDPRAINPGRLVLEMTDMLRRALGERIEVEASVAGGLWNTFADPNQVQNAILTLAINGRDAMPDGGKLTIEVSNAFLDDDYAAQHAEVAAGQYVLIAVTDTGTGMAPDVVARAFEPFFTTKGEGQGTGLGLSQVYGFVKQSGGHVKIYSEVGDGTTVKLYLPRTRRTQETSALQTEAALVGGDETILVVEDDEDVRSAVRDMLMELGYTVLEADSAQGALDVLRGSTGVDLLFSDVVMPGEIHTREMARIAREINPVIKILFTSGYTQNAIVHNGRLDEDVFLLSKPYRKHDLARKLRSLLGEQREPEAPAEKPANNGRTLRKALVVDDEALIRMATTEMVGEIGLETEEAGDGREALAKLAADPDIDLLVTDLSLPGMRGEQLIREARARNPQLTVVVVSGYARDEKTNAELPSDAIFLSKPFDINQLRRALFEA
jgi:signal transduction histidine kinase/DNA-binding response OmpR family regulator